MPKTRDAKRHAHSQAAAALQAKIKQGLTLHQQGRLAEAERIYRDVLRRQPNHFDAVHLLGVMALQPDYAIAYYNRANALKDLKRHEEALADFDKAIAHKPDYAKACNNRGNALSDLGRYAEAIASYDKAIALTPNYADAHNNRGNALTQLRRFPEALASYDKALALKPDYEFLYGNWLRTKMMICDWSNLASEIALLTKKIERAEKASSPFPLLATINSAELQRNAAEIWTRAKYPLNKVLSTGSKRSRHDRIRVAYLSADFREHPMSYLLVGMFEHHDRKRFETVGISFGPDNPSEIRTRLKDSFDRFIDVKNRSDFDVARLLRELEADIAVDLMGYTTNARTAILAHRPSTVQVSFLGYPGTMGADYIDYLIADVKLIPNSCQPYYTEKIAYLPNSYCPNSYQSNEAKGLIADRAFTRLDLGLPQQGFVFCCFNNNYKITPDVFDCWMRILKKVTGSVLWLLEDNASAASNLRKEAAARGLDPERLVFAKRISMPDHLARHRLADLFLDTRPYNAHTTASDALWAGLPVLTQPGKTFAGRVAASLLYAIGLPELITATSQTYEDLAIELASNPEKLAAIKRKLADNRLTTPLFDTQLFTRNIEAAYIAMYERYHAGLPPDHICAAQ